MGRSIVSGWPLTISTTSADQWSRIDSLYISLHLAARSRYLFAADPSPRIPHPRELSILEQLYSQKKIKSIMANDNEDWRPSGRPTSYDG